MQRKEMPSKSVKNICIGKRFGDLSIGINCMKYLLAALKFNMGDVSTKISTF